MEENKDKKQNSNWKKWAAIASIGIASMFGGNTQDVEAASQQYQNNVQNTRVEQKMTQQQYKQLASKLTASIGQCARQKLMCERSIKFYNGKIAEGAANASEYQSKKLACENTLRDLNQQISAMQAKLQVIKGELQNTQQKENTSNSQQSIENNQKTQFHAGLKVAEPMSDAQFWQMANEAKQTGQKISDPAWISKLQQMRQKAARQNHQNNMNKESPEQTR